MRRRAVTAALTIGVATATLTGGSAAAGTTVTARLGIQVRCLSVLEPDSIWSTTGSGQAVTFAVTGTVGGLTPGHIYQLVAGGSAQMTYLDTGAADAAGQVSLTEARGSLTYLRLGRRVGFTVHDDVTGMPVALVSTGKLTADPACGRLGPGTTLARGDATAQQQGDGNLVVAVGGRPVWQAGTSGHPGATTVVQGDGNLVVYDVDGRALWQSGTAGVATRFPGVDPRTLELVLQDDDNLVLYVGGSHVVWQAGSYRR